MSPDLEIVRAILTMRPDESIGDIYKLVWRRYFSNKATKTLIKKDFVFLRMRPVLFGYDSSSQLKEALEPVLYEESLAEETEQVGLLGGDIVVLKRRKYWDDDRDKKYVNNSYIHNYIQQFDEYHKSRNQRKGHFHNATKSPNSPKDKKLSTLNLTNKEPGAEKEVHCQMLDTDTNHYVDISMKISNYHVIIKIHKDKHLLFMNHLPPDQISPESAAISKKFNLKKQQALKGLGTGDSATTQKVAKKETDEATPALDTNLRDSGLCEEYKDLIYMTRADLSLLLIGDRYISLKYYGHTYIIKCHLMDVNDIYDMLTEG